jgi:hypothetical protein
MVMWSNPPSRVLPTTSFVRFKPQKALTAAQSTIQGSPRMHKRRASPAKFLPQGQTFAGVCHHDPPSPHIPADLVVDHKPKIVRRASATDSGFPSAV